MWYIYGTIKTRIILYHTKLHLLSLLSKGAFYKNKVVKFRQASRLNSFQQSHFEIWTSPTHTNIEHVYAYSKYSKTTIPIQSYKQQLITTFQDQQSDSGTVNLTCSWKHYCAPTVNIYVLYYHRIFLKETCSYSGGQVAAFVAADPTQAADNVEHLELELYNRRREEMEGCYKQLAHITKMHGADSKKSFREQETCTAASFQSSAKAAPTSRRLWVQNLKFCDAVPGMCFFGISNALLHFFFFTYCCGLPPSASSLGHLAKHLVAIQRDVFGLLDRLLCHLLAVHVQLDFLRRDGDVELQGGREVERAQLNKTAFVFPIFGRCQM